MQKILFLDIDGVVNSVNTGDRGVRPLHPGPDTPDGWIDGIDPEKVTILNRIIAATGAQIVISSSWRRQHGLAETTDTLRRAGLQADVIGETPHSTPHRSVQIQQFLDAWAGENIAAFIILDDYEDMRLLNHRFVHTDPMNGLSEADADRAITMLLG